MLKVGQLKQLKVWKIWNLWKPTLMNAPASETCNSWHPPSKQSVGCTCATTDQVSHVLTTPRCWVLPKKIDYKFELTVAGFPSFAYFPRHFRVFSTTLARFRAETRQTTVTATVASPPHPSDASDAGAVCRRGRLAFSIHFLAVAMSCLLLLGKWRNSKCHAPMELLGAVFGKVRLFGSLSGAIILHFKKTERGTYVKHVW